MNLNNSFCFYVLCFIHLHAHAQFEFDGQILAQTNIGLKEQLSGHLLRQSVMGSDLSYEDMMEERKLSEVYSAKIIQEENYNESPV